MLVSAIQKFTMLDYPEKTACIVFTPGCNFRCSYCHNPEFVLPEKLKELRSSFIPEEAVFNFLETRKGLLDGVVVTGGEPTIMPDLLAFIKKIKDRGFLVKLDTNGNRPQVVAQAIERSLVDYIAMDVKTSLTEYQRLAGARANPKYIKESIDLVKNSGIDYEFRSTLIKDLHTEEILHDMVEVLRGAKKLYLQRFRSGNTLDPAAEEYLPFSDKEMKEIKELFAPAVEFVGIR
jgi:pyruvate formate lyase activating enzyme